MNIRSVLLASFAFVSVTLAAEPSTNKVPWRPWIAEDASLYSDYKGTNFLVYSKQTADKIFATKTQLATKQDALPYQTNAIPYEVIDGTPDLSLKQDALPYPTNGIPSEVIVGLPSIDVDAIDSRISALERRDPYQFVTISNIDFSVSDNYITLKSQRNSQLKATRQTTIHISIDLPENENQMRDLWFVVDCTGLSSNVPSLVWPSNCKPNDGDATSLELTAGNYNVFMVSEWMVGRFMVAKISFDAE